MPPQHTISYVSIDGAASSTLTVTWDDGEYIATLVREQVSVELAGISKVLDSDAPVLVAQRRAQRFRTDTFYRFADEVRAAWQRGSYEQDETLTL